MFVPDPVISLSIRPEGTETPNFSRALNRFQKEDPTFRVHVDSESSEVSQLLCTYLPLADHRPLSLVWESCIWISTSSECDESTTSLASRVNPESRSERPSPNLPPLTTPTRSNLVERVNTVKSRVTLSLWRWTRTLERTLRSRTEPSETTFPTLTSRLFRRLVNSRLRSLLVLTLQGFQEALDRGQLTGHPMVGIRFVLQDGQQHLVDSSELAFRLAGLGAVREAFPAAKPVVLEPVMTVEVVAPIEFQGAVIGAMNQRKGTIVDTEMRDDEFTLTAEVALNDMFGYASQLRGLTQGKGESDVYVCLRGR